VPEASLKPGATGPVYFTDGSGSALPAISATGIGRNTFRGPIFWDMDGAVSKTFQPLERLRVTFRMEAFNAMNHANFRKLGSTSTGSTSILSPSFGTACCQTQSTSTSTAIVSKRRSLSSSPICSKDEFLIKAEIKLFRILPLIS